MRIFYDVSNKHLIVTPLRNGSTHLHEKAYQYKLIEVTYSSLFKSIIDEVEKKTFIYRDPCLRLMSYYNQFIYVPYASKEVKLTLSKTEIEYHTKLFKPASRGDDLLSDMVFAKDNIIKNYKVDKHTSPQSEYFTSEEYDQQCEDYEIISVEQYNKWLKLTFADSTTKPRPHVINDINITPGNFCNMQKIQNLCMELYKDDYELLEPSITYL